METQLPALTDATELVLYRIAQEGLRAIIIGADLTLNQADRDLVEACRAVRRGEPFVYAGALTTLITEYLQRNRNGDRIPNNILTPGKRQSSS